MSDAETWKIISTELAAAFTRIADQLEAEGGAAGDKRKRGDKDVVVVPRKKREPTAYNLFVKAHTKQIRMQNPGMNQNDVFAKVATLWNDAPENPKNSGAGKKKKGKK